MAHNRPLFIADSPFSRSVKGIAKASPETRELVEEVREIGTTSLLGSEPITDKHSVHESQIIMTMYSDAQRELVTITLQQLSMGAAVLLCVSFFIFLTGYGMGRYQASRSLVETGTTAQVGAVWNLLFSSRLSVPVEHTGTENEYARSATQEEAERISDELVSRGLSVTVKRQLSYSSQGKEQEWFRIIGNSSHHTTT